MTQRVKFLLPLILTGTLNAHSQIADPQTSGFPPQLKHVVVIFQENRTPDNLFHSLSPLCPIPRGAKGLSACTPNPVTTSCYDISPCGVSNKSGTPQPVTLQPIALSSSANPNHQHSTFDIMCDPDPANGYTCRMDGAWRIKPTNVAYSYVTNPPVTNSNGSPGHLLDPYLTYAEQYGWANYMYQTNQGPSYPAHQFIFSGTSARSTADDANSIFLSENFGIGDVGCLAPRTASTSFISPYPGDQLCQNGQPYDGNSVQECPLTNTALHFPDNPVGSFCQNKPTMGSVLDGRNITWKYYAASAGGIWTAPNSIQQICVPQFKSRRNQQLVCTGTEWATKVDLNLKGADVLNDITNCNLPDISWVIPDGLWSDHGSVTGDYGPSWAAAIINALGQNPKCAPGTLDAGQTFWEDTAIVLTWDDWGGWSDNQPPPIQSLLPCTTDNCQGAYQYGFRVPLVVVSAYTPRGYISDKTYDFGSILRMIEGISGVPQGALGVADARATTDLRDFFQGSFRSYTPVPALKDASFFLGHAAQEGAPLPPDDDGD
jgi:phospholipase C